MNTSFKSLKYTIRILSDSEAETWDNFIDNSDKGTLFHKYHWLKAAEKQSKTLLHPLVCEKAGEGIICVFPVFLLKKIFLNILCSPPPGCAIPELGPVFHINAFKQDKIESDYYNTIEAFDTFFYEELNYDYCYFLTNIYDVRSFKWLGYSTDPLYTYKLDLKNNTNRIFENFSKNIRQRIRKIQNSGKVEIKPGHPNNAENIINELKERYSKLNMPFNLRFEYIQTLLELYGKKELKLYECSLNGVHQTTFILTEYKRGMKLWLGAVHNTYIENGVNEFIHWHNIQDASARFFHFYERIGANTQHLCKHKSKYGFSPEIYFKVQKWSKIGKVIYFIFTKLLKYHTIKI